MIIINKSSYHFDKVLSKCLSEPAFIGLRNKRNSGGGKKYAAIKI